MITDIRDEVAAWVADEIGKQRFGEDFAFTVALGAAMAQGPAGPVQVPMWTVLLTARNPMLGEPPLYHGPVAVGAVRPAEDDVRGEVSKGMAALRDLAASKLAGARKPPAGLARGRK